MAGRVDQLQCPNCHNYRITKKNSWLFGCFVVPFGLVAFGYFLLGLVSGTVEILGVGLALVLIPIGVAAFLKRMQPWNCKNCGFQWE